MPYLQIFLCYLVGRWAWFISTCWWIVRKSFRWYALLHDCAVEICVEFWTKLVNPSLISFFLNFLFTMIFSLHHSKLPKNFNDLLGIEIILSTDHILWKLLLTIFYPHYFLKSSKPSSRFRCAFRKTFSDSHIFFLPPSRYIPLMLHQTLVILLQSSFFF